MAFDTKKWLVEEMGFTAEQAETLAPQFADRSEKLEKGYLRQSDYSKQMNDLGKTKADLASANDKLTKEMAEWAALTADEQKRAGDLRAELDASQERIFKLTQKATRLAEDSGIDPKTILGDDPLPDKPKEKPVAAFDPAPLHQQIGGLADYMLTLNAELPAIAQEHFELTGERLDTRAFVAGIRADLKANKTDNLDPVKRWESAFGIAEKRSTKSAEGLKAQLDAAREEGRVAARSEAMLPNTRPVGQGGSPVFRTAGQAGSKLTRPQPTDHMAGARAALASGKYRSGGNGATT